MLSRKQNGEPLAAPNFAEQYSQSYARSGRSDGLLVKLTESELPDGFSLFTISNGSTGSVPNFNTDGLSSATVGHHSV